MSDQPGRVLTPVDVLARALSELDDSTGYDVDAIALVNALGRAGFYIAMTPQPHCDWCGTAIFPDFESNWHDRHADFDCPANTENHTHEPAGSQP